MNREANQVNREDPKLQENMDINKYLGKWYEIYKSKSVGFEGDYLWETYTKEAPNKISMHFSHVLKGKEDQGDGVATFDPARPAQWSVNIKKYIFPRLFTFDYRIIETDYSNYSIVISKNQFLKIFKTEYAWIMGRDKVLNQKIVDHCMEVLERETNFKRSDLILAKQ